MSHFSASPSSPSKATINARLQALRDRHQALESEIADKQKSYAAFDLHALKARKLSIKEELEGIIELEARRRA